MHQRTSQHQRTSHLYKRLTDQSRLLVDHYPVHVVPGDQCGDIQMWRLVSRNPETGDEYWLYEHLVYEGQPFSPQVDFQHLYDAIRFANRLNADAGRDLGGRPGGMPAAGRVPGSVTRAHSAMGGTPSAEVASE